MILQSDGKILIYGTSFGDDAEGNIIIHMIVARLAFSNNPAGHTSETETVHRLLYPSPVTDWLTLQMDIEEKEIRVRITDIQAGRSIRMSKSREKYCKYPVIICIPEHM